MISSTTPVSCFGGSNGTATVSTTGGTGSYSYMWSSGNNLTSTANSGMCPGNQTVTVTDANGCSMSISQTMVNQASPQIDGITFTSPSCNGLTNGSATVFASGIFSSSQFTYLWDAATNAQQTQTADRGSRFSRRAPAGADRGADEGRLGLPPRGRPGPARCPAPPRLRRPQRRPCATAPALHCEA